MSSTANGSGFWLVQMYVGSVLTFEAHFHLSRLLCLVEAYFRFNVSGVEGRGLDFTVFVVQWFWRCRGGFHSGQLWSPARCIRKKLLRLRHQGARGR